jgi:hypothetical protein
MWRSTCACVSAHSATARRCADARPKIEPTLSFVRDSNVANVAALIASNFASASASAPARRTNERERDGERE